MRQTESWPDVRHISTPILSIVVISKRKIVTLKLPLGIASVQMNAWVIWHEVQSFMENRKSLFEPAFFE
jgi:hypothetical protein